MSALLSGILFAGVGFLGCTMELPEAGSEAAAVYTKRCGSCHVLYPPNMLTPKMWAAMVERMEGEMVRARFGPLSDADREIILAYLARNGAER